MNDGAAIIVLARREARKAVEAELRDQGRSISNYSAAELLALASEYLRQHPELLEKAEARLSKIKSAAQRRKA